MKSLKPLLLVLSGVLITVGLFSFKNEEPKKEYCRVQYQLLSLNKGTLTIIYNNDKTEKVGVSSDQKLIQTINQLSSQGWIVASSNSVFNQNLVVENIYLERTQQ